MGYIFRIFCENWQTAKILFAKIMVLPTMCEHFWWTRKFYCEIDEYCQNVKILGYTICSSLALGSYYGNIIIVFNYVLIRKMIIHWTTIVLLSKNLKIMAWYYLFMIKSVNINDDFKIRLWLLYMYCDV